MNDMSQVKSELKPCPFCGGTAELDAMRDYRSIKGQSGSGVAIYCTSCNSDMMLCREDLPECDTDELIEMVRDNWNKRHNTLQSQLTQAQTRIKEYEKQWTDMDRTIGTALRQLNEVQQLAQAQTIRMREGLPTLDNPDIDKRIKVLEACRKRWQECGETECAAICQGAAFELKLFKDQLTQAERRGEEKAREELKSKARDHVAERCDQIAQLQSQLTQSNELASTLKSQWLSMSTQLTQAHKERDEAVAKIIKWGPLVESYELQVKELSAELTQYRVALERCHVALINWHALLRNLKTDYENNSLDVLDQIQSTKSKSLKALELSTPLIEKVRK